MLGAGHHWLGVLAAGRGDTDTALDHLEQAVTIAQELDAPYWIAQGYIEAAAALRSRGRATDGARAARLIADATAIGEPRDYGRVLRQAEALR